MKREIGASAGVLALIAVLLHTQFPPAKEVATGRPPAEQTENARQQETDEHIERREGPWVATRAFFQQGEAPERAGSKAPISPCEAEDADPDPSLRCLIEPKPWTEDRMKLLRDFLGVDGDHLNRYHMWSIVATVADPSHTRLPLFFDRQVEAITRALQPNGFELAGQWMPWADRFDSAEPDISERRKGRKMQREQEQMPGILIFRRFSSETLLADGYPIREALFVFVVPEMPTNGVNGPAFFAALRLAHALSTKETPGEGLIGYLTPTFSGSFESLSALVKQWNTTNPAEAIEGTIYTGMASSVTASDKFQNRTHLQFRSGVASSRDSEAVFCQVLSQYEIAVSDAAYLVEDETGFSQHDFPYRLDQGNSKACNPPRYVFPRDISHLRNVYQQEAPVGVAQRGQAATPGVSFSVKDPNSGEDSVPTFSDAQTPLSQNSVVQSIMDEFRRRRVRLVYIVATNVLDQLFLTQVVHEASPDTRVLTEDPDVLFLAATSQTPLSGTLFLSTYPMFFEGDKWLDTTHPILFPSPNLEAHRILFPSPDFEGLYNSTQAVLQGIRAIQSNDAIKNLQGYAQLDPADPYRGHPGLWLLTLNRSGFSPLNLMDEAHAKKDEARAQKVGKDSQDEHAGWFALAEAKQAKSASIEPPEFPAPPRGWWVTALMTSAFALWSCWLTLRANRGERRWPAWLALAPRLGFYTARLVTIVGGLLALSATEFILFLPVWLSRFENTEWWRWLIREGLGFAGWLMPPYVAFRLWRRRPPRRFQYEAWFYAGLEVALYLIVTVTWLWCCWPTGSPAALFFRFRAIELYSGSSPAVPLFLIGVVAITGSFFYLKRFSRAGFGRPCLKLSAFGSLGPSMWESYRTIARRTAGPASAKPSICFLKTDDPDPEKRRRYLKVRADARESLKRNVPPLILLFIVLLLLRPWLYAAAFEHPVYNYAIAALVTVLLFTLTVASYDLALIWKELNKFLGWIELMPLRPAFRRVARDWPRRPIWASNERLCKQSLAMQMLRALHNRRVILGTAGDVQAFLRATTDAKNFWESLLSRFAANAAREQAPHSAEPVKAVAAAAGGFSSFASGGVRVESPIPPVSHPPLQQPRLEPAGSSIETFPRARRRYETLCAVLLSRVAKDVMPIWRATVIDDLRNANREEAAASADQKDEKLARYCGDFIALQFTKYLIYVVAQIQWIAWFLSFGLLMLILVLNSYSPQAPLLVGRFLAALFLVIGAVVVWVLAGMERNAILSNIARTQPGKLNQEFWLQLIGLGILPLIGVMSHLFPSISNFLSSWLGSGVESLH